MENSMCDQLPKFILKGIPIIRRLPFRRRNADVDLPNGPAGLEIGRLHIGERQNIRGLIHVPMCLVEGMDGLVVHEHDIEFPLDLGEHLFEHGDQSLETIGLNPPLFGVDKLNVHE